MTGFQQKLYLDEAYRGHGSGRAHDTMNRFYLKQLNTGEERIIESIR